MNSGGLLSIDEAAQRLERSPQAVRLMAASGELDAVKRGHSWWLDARAVERRRRESRRSGRPLSPEMAWSILLLASDEPGRALLVASEAHQRSRARQWLRHHPLPEHFASLRARARRESFDAHPAELRRILARRDVMPTGISAAENIGLHGRSATAEFYAPASARAAIVCEHALEEASGTVSARWVPDRIWPVIAAAHAPKAAVLVDLLESDDPRARREAARALARAETVTVRAGDHTFELRRPTLLGAVLIKARSLLAHHDPEAQRDDLLRLLSLVEDPREMAEQMTSNERRWLRRAEPELRLEAPAGLAAADMRRARLAYRLLVRTDENEDSPAFV